MHRLILDRHKIAASKGRFEHIVLECGHIITRRVPKEKGFIVECEQCNILMEFFNFKGPDIHLFSPAKPAA